MAEICLDCYNKLHEAKLKRHDVVLALEEERCEECGRPRRTIVKYSLRYKLKFALKRA